MQTVTLQNMKSIYVRKITLLDKFSILLHEPLKWFEIVLICRCCTPNECGIKQKNLVDAHYWNNNDQF